jgi:hypothetical protein
MEFNIIGAKDDLKTFLSQLPARYAVSKMSGVQVCVAIPAEDVPKLREAAIAMNCIITQA